MLNDPQPFVVSPNGYRVFVCARGHMQVIASDADTPSSCNASIMIPHSTPTGFELEEVSLNCNAPLIELAQV